MRAVTAAILILSVAISSCAFSRLKDDIKVLDDKWRIAAEVDVDDRIEGNLVAIVYTPHHEKQRIVYFKIVDPKVKAVYLMLDPGEYRLALFHDKNDNLFVDEGEPFELVDKGRRLKFSEVRTRIQLELDMPEGKEVPDGYPRDLGAIPEKIKEAFHLSFGDIVNLEDEKFSVEAGEIGLWEPKRFLEEYGAGIYMVEEFDQSRIPVLFVSGASGNPQTWKYFFDHLDKEKFQAWYYLYPSGMRIPRLGNSMNDFVRAMRKKFGFEKLHVVAHSMGGLVSREAVIAHYRDEGPTFITKFVSISTPWNGHAMAEKGTTSSFITPIPSWHDIVPGSEFLQNVFEEPLNGEVEFHLVFGYEPGSGGDGAVALESMLLQEAQADAETVRGYKADHVSILFMDTVFEHVERLLGESEECGTSKEQIDSDSAEGS